MRLPGCQQRTLDRIGHRLAAEEPGLSLRFAFFTRLTRHEAIPLTEQVPWRLQRYLRRGLMLPLMAVSIAALLAAILLVPGNDPACPARASAAAHTMSPFSDAAHCKPGPASTLDSVPVR